MCVWVCVMRVCACVWCVCVGVMHVCACVWCVCNVVCVCVRSCINLFGTKLPALITTTSTLTLRSVTLLDNECRQVNDKLRRLAAVLPDATTLPPVDYNTSKRADPEVLQKLVNHAKILKVY